jgi:hypothetical protein
LRRAATPRRDVRRSLGIQRHAVRGQGADAEIADPSELLAICRPRLG